MKKVILQFAFLLFTFSAFSQTANFTADKFSGCAPVIVQFTDLSTGATKWDWVFGNGNTSNIQSPQATYANPGVYNVILTINKGLAGEKSITKTITVFKNPIADFTTSTLPGCVNQPITFTDNTIIGDTTLVSWQWDFGDGAVQSTGSNTINHTYTVAAIYPVTMTVTDANGCTSVKVISVQVLPQPILTVSSTGLSSCTAPFTVKFTNTSTTFGSSTPTWQWNFGDGNTSTNSDTITNTYTANGTYPVTLSVMQGGCLVTTTVATVIVGGIVADFNISDIEICQYGSVTFTNTSAPNLVSSQWNFGDAGTSNAASPTHPYNTAGTFDVTLIVTDNRGCKDTIVQPVTVNPKPDLNFSVDNPFSCKLPFNVTATPTTGAGTYVWDFGDGTGTLVNGGAATHTYTGGGGTISCIYTDVNGCIDTAYALVIYSAPVADFTVDIKRGCEPIISNFIDLSSSADPIVQWNWSFNAITCGSATPATSTSQNPTNVSFTEGNYDITLTITTQTGCTATITKPNYIRAGNTPVVDFTISRDTVCHGDTVQFINLSSVNTCSGPSLPDSAFWEYAYFNSGDYIPTGPPGAPGSYIGLIPPLNPPVWDTDNDTLGTWNTKLTIWDRGCKGELIKNDFWTIVAPISLFNIQNDCSDPLKYTFRGNPQAADSMTWKLIDQAGVVTQIGTGNNLFGAADPTDVDTIGYTFPSPGQSYDTYTIKLLTYSKSCPSALDGACYCIDSTSLTFNVSQLIPNMSIIPNPQCRGSEIRFTDLSMCADGGITINYDYPNYNNTVDSTVTILMSADTGYTYVQNGIYDVEVTFRDINGCQQINNYPVTVFGPYPGFSSIDTTGCVPFAVTFRDTSVSDSLIVQRIWDFDNNGVSDLTTAIDSAINIYNTPGTYTVRMTVTDKNSCTYTVSKQYVLATFPYPKLTILDNACKNQVLTFDASATSVLNNTDSLTYYWDFGDGSLDTTKTSQNTITHSYANEGKYYVTLRVVDMNGCDSLITDSVLVEHPKPGFTVSQDIKCGQVVATFTDTTYGTIPITQWQWDFGNGAVSVLQNPSNTYSFPGYYDVTLIATNSIGCKDTILVDSLVVVPGPLGTFRFDPDNGCTPLTVEFIGNSDNTLVYTWDYGDGVVEAHDNSSSADTSYHTYYYDIVATPYLYLTSTIKINGKDTVCTTSLPPVGTIDVNTLLDVQVVPKQSTLAQDSTVVLVSSVAPSGSNDEYSWSSIPASAIVNLSCTNCPNPTVTGTGEGGVVQYILTVKDLTSNCAGFDTITVNYPECITLPVIPNIVTPNEDGFNDFFKVNGICSADKFLLVIFDRWGLELFRTDDRKAKWDCTYNGNKVTDGVYYYIVTINDSSTPGFFHVVNPK